MSVDELIPGSKAELRAAIRRFDLEVAAIVDMRAGPFCERCGRFTDYGYFSRQHRIAQGMGGTRRLVVHSVSNRVRICGSATSTGGCHAWCENRANREQAEFEGYVLPINNPDVRPELAPILLHTLWGPRWFYLLNDGSKVPLTDREIEAHERNRP